jgi:alpha-tubulin suppressor-like RCC1 family protein
MRTTAFIRRATFAFGLVAAFAMSAAAAAPASASRAVSWGNNQYGQLGNDTSGNIAKTPVQVCAAEYTGVVPCTSYLQGVKSVAASYEYSLALLENGTVVAWGENNVGQLGNNTTTNSSVPVHVCEPEWNPPNQYAAGSGCAPGSYLGENVAGWKVTAISAGICNAMALLEDGEVVTWGANNSACGGEGDLGNDTTTNSSVPVFVCEPNNTVPDCADASKRLGSGAEKVTQISTGGWHDLALLNTGTVLAWGFNYFGQLGNEESGSNLLEPAWVCSESATPRGYSQTNPCSNHMEVLSSVKEVSAGALSSLALLDNGTVRSWGNNLSSQLGDGIPGVDASEKNPLPVKVCEGPTQSTKCPPGAELDKVEAISASGSYGGLALRNGSYVGPLVSVAGWGNNYSGQLGDDAIPAIHQYSDPIEMFGSHGVEAISAGASDTLVRDGNAFDTGGYVEATGDNADGELGNGTLTSTDLLANVCAVRASSCRLGPYLEHAQDISTGSSHNLAVVPALCGPPTSPGDQGREGICNWYNDTSLLSPVGSAFCNCTTAASIFPIAMASGSGLAIASTLL